MSKKYTVYAIIDPDNGKMVYVGCTGNLQSRLKQHYDYSSNTKRWEYMTRLKHEGKEPIIKELYVFNNIITARVVERVIISFVKKFINPDLLNIICVLEDRHILNPEKYISKSVSERTRLRIENNT